MEAFAGCRSFEILGSPGLAMYPTESPERLERVGPYTLQVAMDAPAAAGSYPLVVISHGGGGSHLVYRDLARHLARNGFLVALPEHPGNNRNNNELANTALNLTDRPRHIRLTIDWAFANLTPSAVALVGHSLGGYTALAVAGGAPTAFAHETSDQQVRPVEVTADERVKALVLLAPATVWFMMPDALSGVRVPILMLTAEKDPHTPPMHAEIVKRGVPEGTQIEHKTIANAGHFSFLSPFPESMTQPGFAPSQDPEGFDRKLFHMEMNAAILGFLQRVFIT